MSTFQKVIKYCAIAFAVMLAIGIITTMASAATAIISLVSGVSGKFVHRDSVNVDFNQDRITRKDLSESFQDVKNLDIDIDTGSLQVINGDTLRVEAENVPDDFEAKVTSNGTLILREKARRINFLWFNFNINNNLNSKIILYLPADLKLKETEIDTGAGKVTIEGLSTKELFISAGAGNVDGRNIQADKVVLDGGVGSVSFKDIYFEDMDLDCGVGNVWIEGKVIGDSTIDCGVGNVDLNLIGRPEDYDFDIEAGVGRVRLNGERISKEYRKNNEAASSIEIDGGVGNVEINFTSVGEDF
jgi:DUF4097 and DUF4098 domain-containing protein YvlB